MVEVASGAIAVGVRYHVGNTNQAGTGTITYNSVVYNIGGSFLGKSGITTYSATLTAKVYADDTATEVHSLGDTFNGDEISYFPESTEIHSLEVIENFNENEEVYFPENTEIHSIIPTNDGLIYYYTDQDATDNVQAEKNFIHCETKARITSVSAEIEAIIGEIFYSGLSYSELDALSAHPEVTIRKPATNNIDRIDINGIAVFTALRT